VHYNPAEAMCDGPQALLPEMFADLMGDLARIAAITNKEFGR
jgi:3-deoxy-7-phosphoheptulonate synthase